MTPFSFTFVRGSEKLTLHVNKEGIRHKNWDIQPKIFPPEVVYDLTINAHKEN